MKKVLHIFGRMNPGGAELRTLDIMKNSSHFNVEWHFCALSGKPGTLDEHIRKLGGFIHYLPLDISFPTKFIKLLKQQNIDVIHSHVYYFSGLLLFLAYLAGIKVRIAHFRTMQAAGAKTLSRSALHVFLKQLIDKYATHIVGVSRSTLNKAWNPNWEDDSRCRVIYNGFNKNHIDSVAPADLHRILNLDPSALIFGHLGRIVPAKNHLRLLEIFDQIYKKHPNCALCLIGSTPDKDLLHQIKVRSRALNIEHRVYFLGERNDIFSLLKSTQLMLFPSTREGLPGAVIESAMCYTPVLASPLPGVLEIKKYLSGVYTVPLEQSNEEWAIKALALAKAPRVITNTHDYINPFNLASSISDYMYLWGTLSENTVLSTKSS